jgi:cell division transport system permease protein
MIRWSTIFGSGEAPFAPPERDLLPRDGAGERWLGGVIAVLCFVACLAGVGALAAERAAGGWARELRSEATVQVRPGVGETGDAAAARATEALAGVTGVEEAAAMDRATAEKLLTPWMGEAALEDMALPHLVTVRLDAAAPASALVLGRALAEAGIDATVDDHSLWRGEVERSAATVTLLALAAFLAVAGATGAAIVHAVRAGVEARRSIIETLSLSGATDAAIAWLFQRRFALLALIGGAAGTGVALALAALVRFLGGGEGLSPALPLAWSDLLILSPTPVVAATVALVAARLSAGRALARLGGDGRAR